MRKKVLMVANQFPPMGGSGVQRSVKFAKYLPDLIGNHCLYKGMPARLNGRVFIKGST